MDIQVGFMQLCKLGVSLVNHKILQYRLRTNETVVLKTNYGMIKGIIRKTVYNESYSAFEGIPYAQPPLGELKFRAPQPAKSWEDILDCTNSRHKPIQSHIVLPITEGSENCLHLNVYVKNLKSEKPLPVLVFIYGGGYQSGEASRDLYAPDYFMNEDVVLVQANYRVGPLGFLSFDDPDLDVPGNAGLKDQVLALRWIKENIMHFNGDAENITLFGESAGASSTHYMMLTDKTKGLFHKAIIQSGSALCHWALNNRNYGYRLARELGYKGANNDKQVFRFLMQVDPRKFPFACDRLITKQERLEYILFAFSPVVEPYITEQCILPKTPVEMMKTAWSNEIPLIIGANSYEGLFSYQTAIYHPHVIDDLKDCTILLPEQTRRERHATELKEMALELKQTFFNNEEPCAKRHLHRYLDLLTYKFCWHGMHRTLLSRLAYAETAPTYLYRFDFYSEFFNHYRILTCGNAVRGVSHADDLSYLFYNISSNKLPKESMEYKTIERMIGMWTSFARTSNPNCAPIKPTLWQPVTKCDEIHKCLNISENVMFTDMPEWDKFKLWNSFYRPEELF